MWFESVYYKVSLVGLNILFKLNKVFVGKRVHVIGGSVIVTS